LQGTFLMTSVVRRLENVYLQRQLGSISDESWESREALFDMALTPGYAYFIETTTASFIGEEFLKFMAQIGSD
jgi:hypothetical protein